MHSLFLQQLVGARAKCVNLGDVPRTAGVIPPSSPFCKAPLMDPGRSLSCSGWRAPCPCETQLISETGWGKLEREPPGFLKWRNFSFNFLCFHYNSLNRKQNRSEKQNFNKLLLGGSGSLTDVLQMYLFSQVLKNLSYLKVAVLSAC